MSRVVNNAARARSSAWLAGYGAAWTKEPKPCYSKANWELGVEWDKGNTKGLMIKAETGT